MKGPFFLGSVDGKPFLVDGCGRVLNRETVNELISAGLNLWDWSGAQITQQHSTVARAFQKRGGR